MLLHVLAQVAATNKSLGADFALVGLLTTVDSFVANKIAYLGEGSLADFTHIRFDLLMNCSLMFDQGRVLDKTLVAL